MTILRRKPKTLVMTDRQEPDDLMWRAVRLDGDGTLSIVGHDVGDDVEQFFGCREYEFARRLSKRETATLRELLGVPRRGDLLAAIGERFEASNLLEEFLRQNGITGTFWNRTSG